MKTKLQAKENMKIELYENEFPDFELDVKIPVGFSDISYHNDVMPCWFKPLNGESQGFRLWIDYADQSKSEYPNTKTYNRFILQFGSFDYGEFSDLVATDNYSLIEAFIEG
jgi:hypothetical protein|tara:strand:+ start:224 stop:556 length:333 start_codon:yes stop_codon:yes gene_type:complete